MGDFPVTVDPVHRGRAAAWIASGWIYFGIAILAGLLYSLQFVGMYPFPDTEWLSPGRVRVLHTNGVAFGTLAATMFGFDYRIECYVPAPKRRYGYYVLPILHRGRLVGRLDAKAHRAEGVFEVKALYLEPGIQADEALVAALAAAIGDCAGWHATPQVRLDRCDPKALRTPLRAALAACAKA